MSHSPYTPSPSRIGFHYFYDTYHYRQSDINRWLPVLQTMGASWLTLIAPQERAIPENFITGLLQNGINPILHHHLQLDNPPTPNDLQPLYQAYARWGVRYISLFDRPNRRIAWPTGAWAQPDLVDRFLDIYLPLAETAQQAGLIPVFPPLEPGGDFWDTSFIRLAAQSLRRRYTHYLSLPWVFGCYAWAGNRSLDWGAGGPERWPGAKPYGNPVGEQDQCGFRIYEWYLSLAQAELRQPCNIILIGAGSRLGDRPNIQASPVDEISHAWQNIEIAKRLTKPMDSPNGISDQVLTCNYWLLAAEPGDPYAQHAWFTTNGRSLPVVSAFYQWRDNLSTEPAPASWHTTCNNPITT